MTIRKTRKKVDEIHAQLTPTIENIEAITTKIQPAIEKVDPLIERVSLTIDAANLELMRADQILENVNTITEGVSTATTAVGNIANAPAELLSKAGKKISGLIGGKHGSDTVGQLGDGDNVDQIISQSRKQNRKFGRKIVRNKETVNAENKKDRSSGNPFVSFN